MFALRSYYCRLLLLYIQIYFQSNNNEHQVHEILEQFDPKTNKKHLQLISICFQNDKNRYKNIIKNEKTFFEMNQKLDQVVNLTYSIVSET